MKNYGVALHGNLPLDNIYIASNSPIKGANSIAKKFIQRPGGIANLANAFKELDPGFPVMVNSSVGMDWYGDVITFWLASKNIISNIRYSTKLLTSSACIIIDEVRSDQTSVVKWGACQFISVKDIFDVGQEYIWNHFAYIDTFNPTLYRDMLPKIQKLRYNGCIVSADLAGVFVKTPDNFFHDLSLFDYIFISIDDIYKYRLPESSKIIYHGPSSIALSWDNDSKYTGVLNPEIVDCVGAGDILAAVIIKTILDLGRTIDATDLENIYNTTENILLKQQEIREFIW